MIDGIESITKVKQGKISEDSMRKGAWEGHGRPDLQVTWIWHADGEGKYLGLLSGMSSAARLPMEKPGALEAAACPSCVG